MAKTVFIDGNPSQGVQGTKVLAAFLNAIFAHVHDGVDADGHAPVLEDGHVAFFSSGRKLWIYENVAPAGWAIVAAAADAVLAVKGGENAYNVNGGTQAGTWTQPNHLHSTADHTLTLAEMPIHGHTTGLTLEGSGVWAWPTGGFGSSTSTSLVGGGGAHNHGNTEGGATASTWRPLAQVGIIISKN